MAVHSKITSTERGETIAFPQQAVRAEQRVGIEPHHEQDSGAGLGLEISALLQSTLEWNKVLTLFNNEARSNVAFDALNYSHPAEKINFELGVSKHHKASYQLTIGSHTLGTLTFSHRRRFGEAQLALIEEMIVGLVYPLRNALLYRRALQAAQRDPLTGIGNRSALEEALKREIDLAQRNAAPLAMMVLDIDHFKQVNDTYGHAAGDCALKRFAETVNDCARGSDMLFRFGGEEFVLLLNNTDIEGAALFGERIRNAIEQMELECDGSQFKITVSIGISTLRSKDSTESLFNRADHLLYNAKTGGRNRVCTTK